MQFMCKIISDLQISATVVCTLYVMFSEYDFSVDDIYVFLGEINRVNCILIVSAVCQLRVKTGVG